MAWIQLSNGLFTEVDDEDAIELMCICTWNYNPYRGGYVQGRLKDGKNIYMHLIIAKRMGLAGPEIDHIDHDPLNNKKNNLRSATHSEQCRNSGIRSDNTSGYKGINWHKKDKKWRVRIWIKSTEIYIGEFESLEYAIAMRRQAIKYHYGEFANPDEFK